MTRIIEYIEYRPSGKNKKNNITFKKKKRRRGRKGRSHTRNSHWLLPRRKSLIDWLIDYWKIQQQVVVCRIGNVVWHINEVTLRQALLVLGWVTVYGWVNHLSMQQPPRLTQPSTLRGTVKWVSAFGLSNNNKWRWWMRFTGCLQYYIQCQ